MNFRPLAPMLLAFLCIPRSAFAEAPKLSATLQLLTDAASPVNDRRAAEDRTDDLVVRFLREPDAAERAELRARGLVLDQAPLASGAFRARGGRAALPDWSQHPLVQSVDHAGPSPFLRRLDVDLLEATRVSQGARAILGDRGLFLDGRGETIGDIDSDAFVFHPTFFRADGGAFAWIDVDADGVLTPGTDAIDLDRDGIADPGERALALTVELRDLRFEEVEPHAGLDATLDYLFLDEDGNGRRDFGTGFSEQSPAFGEPIFVVDDANGNGRLEPSERLLRLGSTKFSMIHRNDQTWVRGGAPGAGIIDYGNQLIAEPETARSIEHGTYMTAVIAGGNGSHRIRGLAPGADLVLVPSPSVTDIGWLAEQKIVAASMPIGMNVGTPLDGSSELERMVDALWEKNILTSVSVGNEGGAQAHASLLLEPEQPIIVPYEIWYPAAFTYFSAVVADPLAKLELTFVDESDVPLPKQGGRSSELTGRGTRMVLRWIATGMASGAYRLRVTLRGSRVARTVHLFTQGDIGAGSRFLDHVSAASTLGSPATADRAFGATGFVLHAGANYGLDEGSPGELAAFASRGPRIDGRSLEGLAAPVNPVGATFLAEDVRRVAVRAWPGTSCASPQLAAAAALIHQAHPEASAEDLRTMLLQGARTDAFTNGNVDEWGAGKLDLVAALGLPSLSLTPPTLSLQAPERVARGASFDVSVSVASTPASTVSVRWDLDYDGAWDTDFEPATAGSKRLQAPAEGGLVGVRVEARDQAGNTVGASTRVETFEPSPSRGSVTKPEEKAASEPASASDLGGGCAVDGRRGGPLRCAHVGWMAVALTGIVRRARRTRRRGSPPAASGEAETRTGVTWLLALAVALLGCGGADAAHVSAAAGFAGSSGAGSGGKAGAAASIAGAAGAERGGTGGAAGAAASIAGAAGAAASVAGAAGAEPGGTGGAAGGGTAGASGAPSMDASGNVASIVAGGYFTCAHLQDGSARCWGDNEHGELGWEGEGTSTPTLVPGLPPVRSLAAGLWHACALTEAGTVWCWGANGLGALGHPGPLVRSPAEVAGLTGIVAIAAGGYWPYEGPSCDRSCALTAGGAVICWGGCAYATAQHESKTVSQPTPTTVAGLAAGARAVAVGGQHACAVDAAGEVFCWGYGYAGQLGVEIANDEQAPPSTALRKIPGLTNAVALAAGFAHTCALLEDRSVWCWGSDASGELGNGDGLGSSASPTRVVGAKAFRTVSAGGRHGCAVSDDGVASCWGGVGSGEVGDGTFTAARQTPVVVGALADLQAISAGAFHTCAVRADRSAWCWGRNVDGQVGVDPVVWQHASPQHVPGL